MRHTGKEYAAEGIDAAARDIRKRRAVYLTGDEPTYEQKTAIEVLERGFHGEWDGKDPYDAMRRAEALGIELAEEEQTPDGKWKPVPNPDVAITTMTAGAL